MSGTTHNARRGVTLLELMVAMMVMSIIAAIIMPVIVSATDSYTSARTLRQSTESVAYASDQMARIIRKAPSGVDGVGLGISVGTNQRVLFLDGTGFEYDGTDLSMLVPGEDSVLLCRDVDLFRVQYIAADGRSSAAADPTTAHRIVYTIQTQDSIVSGIAFPRVWIGQEES